MANRRCIKCLLNKTKIYFDIERARKEAKKLAIENEKTFAIYKEKNAVAFTDAQSAITKGLAIIEMVSKYP